MAAYGVTRHGNASTGSARGFEGKNILEFVRDMDRRPALAEARRKLFDARKTRIHPGRDEKVLTSWNGLRPVPLPRRGGYWILGITARWPSAMRNSFYEN